MATKQIRITDIKKGNVKVEDSRISRRQRAIESQFNNLLLKATQFIIDRVGIDKNATVDTIIKDFRPIISESARSTLGSFYDLGAIYSAVVAGKMHFTTERDLEIVKLLTDDFTNKFFIRAFMYLWREREIDFNLFTQEVLSLTNQNTMTKKMQPLLLKNNIHNLITTFGTKAINMGIMSKTRQIQGNDYQLVTRRAALKDFELELLGSRQSELGEDIQHNIDLAQERNRQNTLNDLINNEFTEPQAISPLVVWVTAEDDRVCFQYCQPLQGEVFNINDADTPIPPDDTHPNCRCRLFNMNESGNAIFDLF